MNFDDIIDYCTLGLIIGTATLCTGVNVYIFSEIIRNDHIRNVETLENEIKYFPDSLNNY